MIISSFFSPISYLDQTTRKMLLWEIFLVRYHLALIHRRSYMYINANRHEKIVLYRIISFWFKKKLFERRTSFCFLLSSTWTHSVIIFFYSRWIFSFSIDCLLFIDVHPWRLASIAFDPLLFYSVHAIDKFRSVTAETAFFYLSQH